MAEDTPALIDALLSEALAYPLLDNELQLICIDALLDRRAACSSPSSSS